MEPGLGRGLWVLQRKRPDSPWLLPLSLSFSLSLSLCLSVFPLFLPPLSLQISLSQWLLALLLSLTRSRTFPYPSLTVSSQPFPPRLVLHRSLWLAPPGVAHSDHLRPHDDELFIHFVSPLQSRLRAECQGSVLHRSRVHCSEIDTQQFTRNLRNFHVCLGFFAVFSFSWWKTQPCVPNDNKQHLSSRCSSKQSRSLLILTIFSIRGMFYILQPFV